MLIVAASHHVLPCALPLGPPACPSRTSLEPAAPLQASAAELFDFWSDHCGHGGSAAQGLAASPSVDSLAGRNGAVGSPPAAELLQPLRRRSNGLSRVDGADDGGSSSTLAGSGGNLAALLGGEEERRSLARRARDVLLYGGAVLAAGAADAWRALRQVLQRGRGDGSFELGVRKAHSSAVGLAGVRHGVAWGGCDCRLNGGGGGGAAHKGAYPGHVLRAQLCSARRPTS